MHILRLVLLGIAIGVAAILGWRFIGNPFDGDARIASRQQPAAVATPRIEMTQEEARQRVEAALADAGGYEVFLAAIKDAFPALHENAIAALAARTQENGRMESADFYVAGILRNLRQSHGVLAAQASDAALERIFALHANVLNSLAKSDPRLCADFLYGKASDGFFKFASANRDLVAAMAQANFDAILDGRRENVKREAPRNEDISELEALLARKGLGQQEIEALLDGRTPEPPLPDKTMCHAGSVYFETLRDLPADVRMKIYATVARLLARS